MDPHPRSTSQSPQTGQVYFNGKEKSWKHYGKKTKSQSPQTGQVYFNWMWLKEFLDNSKEFVTIPSNGSSLFQFLQKYVVNIPKQVTIPSNGSSLFQYGNRFLILITERPLSHNPLKRVKFISICSIACTRSHDYCHNPLKRVKFISIEEVNISTEPDLDDVTIPSNGSSLFQFKSNIYVNSNICVTIPSNGSSLFQ